MKKTKWLPLLVVLALLIGQTIYFLQVITTEPAKNWSRAVALHASTKYQVQPFFDEENDTVSFMAEGAVKQVGLKKPLTGGKESTLAVDMEPNSPLWVDGEEMAFIRGRQLVFRKGQTETVVVENCSTFSGSADQLYYAVDQKLYQFDGKTAKGREVASFAEPIKQIVQAKSSDDVLVAIEKPDETVDLHLLQNNQTRFVGNCSFSVSEKVSEIAFDSDGKVSEIVLGTVALSQGQRQYRAFHLTLDQPKPEVLVIQSASTSYGGDPKNFSVRISNGVARYLFVANGETARGQSSVNVYEGSAENGIVRAERRSILETVATNPIWVNEGKEIAWLDFDGERYQLTGASSDAKVLSMVNKTTSTDVKDAVLDTVQGTFSSLLVVLFGLLWILPLSIFYTVLYFVKNKRFENNQIGWIEPVGILIFLITQVLFIVYQFSEATFAYAPSYLQFSNAAVVWSIGLLAVSYGFSRLAKGEEVSPFANISFIVGWDIVFAMLLFGPYLL